MGVLRWRQDLRSEPGDDHHDEQRTNGNTSNNDSEVIIKLYQNHLNFILNIQRKLFTQFLAFHFFKTLFIFGNDNFYFQWKTTLKNS